MTNKCPKCNSENPETASFCAGCGTQLPSSEQIEVTATIEAPKEKLTTGSAFAKRYQIIEELGKGGMGKVYKVHDTKIKEKIALKLIKPEIAKNKKTIERFSNELRLARKIRHKNICQMFDLGEEKGTHFITMEFVPGQDLKGLIRQSGQLAMGTTLNIAKQICAGLTEAHKSGVVHRDLKPSNIMIDKEGNVRIMDFGIARSLEAKGITGAGVMMGTPEYMSPEQVEGKDIDQRSDIYSLGIILYEMVTGRVPFEGDTPFTVGIKHKSEIPKAPHEINTQIPEDLNYVILKCLEKDKGNRYQSSGELLTELTAIEKGIPTTEKVIPKRKPLTSREITVQFILKKFFIPALVVIALAVIAIVTWQVMQKKEAVPTSPSDKPSLAVMYFENRTSEPDLDKILVDMLTTNLSRYKSIEVVSSQRLFDVLKQIGSQDAESIDKSVATEVARRAGVMTMLLGSIIKIGDKIRISSQLIKVQDGAIIGSEQVEGNKIDDIFDMVDELTVKVGNKLDVSSEERGQRFKIADATTDSFEAYRYYQKGLESCYRLNWSEAEKNLKKAVEIDPTFAMAYLHLARQADPFAIINPFTDITDSKKTLDLAKKYAYKVTDKERLAIDAWMSLYNRDFALAFNLSENLVNTYPKYKQGYHNLKVAGWCINEFEVSRIASERLLEMDPTNGAEYNALAYSHSFSGNHPEAVSAFKKYKTLLPDDWNTYDSGWEIYMRAGEFDEAINICEEGLRRNSEWRFLQRFIGYSLLFKGEVNKARDKFRHYIDIVPTAIVRMTRDIEYSYLFEGRYVEALTGLKKAVELAQKENNAEQEMYARFNLGKMFVVLKKYGQAIEEYAQAEKISWEIYNKNFNPIPIFREYLIGIALADKGDFDETKNRVEKMKHIIQEQDFDALYMDFYYLLLGELNIDRGKGKVAQANIEHASGETKLHSPHYRKLSSSAYTLNGDFEKAIEIYHKLYGAVDLRAWGMGDYFYFIRECSLVNYNVANVYEIMGKVDNAIEHYEKFLYLWKDADPGLPEVDDARTRLARLKSQ